MNPETHQNPRRRTLIAMMDGFGPDYLVGSEMPNLQHMIQEGTSTLVEGCLPSVTNVNNASICTGVWPDVHGITANSYFDRETRQEHYMDRAEMLLAPTLFEGAKRAGVKSALLTAKAKTIKLLNRGTDLALAAEQPSPEWVRRLGPAPDIYSADINLWMWRAALVLLQERPEIGLLYCHTTDYVMHMSDPAGELSQDHLRRTDQLFGQIMHACPDLAFGLTADHGMQYKKRCYDLNKYMPAHGCPIFFAMSTERDPYVKHHRTFGGSVYVWLNHPQDHNKAVDVLMRCGGVEGIYDRQEAASRFRLHPERIGDLLVLGDADTVFGPMDRAMEDLPKSYRNHGSRHESRVPLVVYGTNVDPGTLNGSTRNLDLARLLRLPEQC